MSRSIFSTSNVTYKTIDIHSFRTYAILREGMMTRPCIIFILVHGLCIPNRKCELSHPLLIIFLFFSTRSIFHPVSIISWFFSPPKFWFYLKLNIFTYFDKGKLWYKETKKTHSVYEISNPTFILYSFYRSQFNPGGGGSNIPDNRGVRHFLPD